MSYNNRSNNAIYYDTSKRSNNSSSSSGKRQRNLSPARKEGNGKSRYQYYSSSSSSLSRQRLNHHRSRSRSRSRSRNRSPLFNRTSNRHKDSYYSSSSGFKRMEERMNPMANKTLAVFNLDRRVREQDLYDLYGEFGCKKCQIITDKQTNLTRGFGFVSFAREEDAVKAKSKTNGKFLFNRQIRVDYSIVDRANSKFSNADSYCDDDSNDYSGYDRRNKSVSYSDQRKQSRSSVRSLRRSSRDYRRKSIDVNGSSRYRQRGRSNRRDSRSRSPYHHQTTRSSPARRKRIRRSSNSSNTSSFNNYNYNGSRNKCYSRGPRTPSTTPPPSSSSHSFQKYRTESISPPGQRSKQNTTSTTTMAIVGPRTPSTTPPPPPQPSSVGIVDVIEHTTTITTITTTNTVNINTKRFSDNYVRKSSSNGNSGNSSSNGQLFNSISSNSRGPRTPSATPPSSFPDNSSNHLILDHDEEDYVELDSSSIRSNTRSVSCERRLYIDC